MNNRISEGPTTDLLLWQEITKDNTEAFNRLFYDYWPALNRFATSYLADHSEREEVLQELFIELYQKRHHIHIRSSLHSFLKAFTRNRILNYLRNRSLYQKHVVQAGRLKMYSEDNTEAKLSMKETEARIRQALSVMPLKYRQVYVLNRECQYSLVKVASLLNRPLATVEKQLVKALQFLRGELAQRDNQNDG